MQRWKSSGWMILLSATCVALGLQISPAQAGPPLVIGGFVGGAHLPLDRWSDFFRGLQFSKYESERLSPIWGLSIGYVMRDRHVLKLHVERLTVQAHLNSVAVNNNPPGARNFVVSWDIEAIPVNLSYEFWLNGVSRPSPFFGLGGGYYFSKVEAHLETLHDSVLGDRFFDDAVTREGKGYGVHIYAGVRAPINSWLALVSSVRGRYSDGMAFTDDDKAVPVEFTGVDLTLGFDLRIW